MAVFPSPLLKLHSCYPHGGAGFLFLHGTKMTLIKFSHLEYLSNNKVDVLGINAPTFLQLLLTVINQGL